MLVRWMTVDMAGAELQAVGRSASPIKPVNLHMRKSDDCASISRNRACLRKPRLGKHHLVLWML